MKISISLILQVLFIGGTLAVCKQERKDFKETNILVSSFVLKILDSVINLLCTHVVWHSNLLAFVRVCLLRFVRVGNLMVGFDQVPGKEIHCECGAENCRGQLL